MYCRIVVLRYCQASVNSHLQKYTKIDIYIQESISTLHQGQGGLCWKKSTPRTHFWFVGKNQHQEHIFGLF